MNKAVFLDRDGTVVVDRGYLADPAGIALLPGAGDALRRLQEAGFILVLATNQSGVGRRMFEQAAVTAQHQRLRQLLQPFGVELAAIEVCYHAPEDHCPCRKPAPEMLCRAARNLQIDLRRSFMVGDKDSDILAGHNAGCQTVQVGQPTDRGSHGNKGTAIQADWQVAALPQAATVILDAPRTMAVIPARYGSTRFPGKPLARIAGKPMIEWVYNRVLEARRIQDILVATDHPEILDTVRGFGGQAVMTSPDHPTGTDRILEAIADHNADLIVNVQGDEPLLRGRFLDQLISRMLENQCDMATIAVPFPDDADAADPNLVKVVLDAQGRALYFSRAPIPFPRTGGTPVKPLLHWGVYAYRRTLLEAFVTWPQGVLERCEMLEQLRVLENGVPIQVTIADKPTVGVDRPEDIAKVEKIILAEEAAT